MNANFGALIEARITDCKCIRANPVLCVPFLDGLIDEYNVIFHCGIPFKFQMYEIMSLTLTRQNI